MPLEPPNTKPLIDKLGVKTNMRLSVRGMDARGFMALVGARTRDVAVETPQHQSDLIFLGVSSRYDLESVRRLIGWMKISGALWIIYPKGVKTVTGAQVREAGLAAGLVDNKVVRFSETHTGLRFVIPLRNRSKPGTKGDEK